MGLLDSLFNSDTYGGQNGGLLDFLRNIQMQNDVKPNGQGFPLTNNQPSPLDTAAYPSGPGGDTFASRFGALPNAPPVFAPSGRSFDTAQFNPQTYAPNQARPIAVGDNYQMPRIGSADQFASSQPAQGTQQAPPQIQPQVANANAQAPAAPPDRSPLPTFLSNQGGLGAGVRGFLNNAQTGPIGALLGGIGSAMGMQNPAQQNQAAQYHATRQALIGNGLDETQASRIAMLSVMNPEAAKTVLPELLTNKEKFMDTGTDILGRPVKGFVNEREQLVNGKPIGQGSSSGIMTGLDENKPIFGQLPKPQQAIVDNMLAGRMAVPSAQALKTPYWNTLIAAANEKGQENGTPFDATQWGLRNKTAKDFSPAGAPGQSLNALDTVQKHIGKLSGDIEKLDNGGWTAWNMLRNGIASNTPLDPERRKAAQAVDDDIKAVTDEMARAYKGGHMSDSEIKSWEKLVSSVQSKESGRQALSDFTELLNGKRQSLIDQHKGIMGTEPPGMNQEENKRITGLVHERNAGVSDNAAPTIQEGATATNPQTGQKITFRNGKWQ